MFIQGKIIREYALPTIWLNVGIYIQNWLSKVVQIYRKRYLHGWWARKHRCYWLVTFEKRAVLVNKIHMTRNTHMDEYIIFSLPLSSFRSFFFFGSSYSLFQGLLHDIDTETVLYVLTEHWKKSNPFLPSLGPMFWACAFWRSLWSSAGLRGLSPEGTSCQYCRKSFLFLMKTEKALAALDQSLPPGNSRPQGFLLENCLEVLHGNEEWMWNCPLVLII